MQYNIVSNRTSRSFFLNCTGRAGLLAVVLAVVFSPCFAQDDAATLQLRSSQLIDSAIEHFRKTGDDKSLLPQLQQAEKDLLVSSKTFLNNGDLANATVSLFKLGTAQRLLESWTAAKSSFKASYETAVRAGDAVNQAKALRGMAMADYYGLNNYDAAVSNIEESIRLSSNGPDKKVLVEALELKASIQESRGDLMAAAETINRAYVVASELKDDMSLFYALFGRASVYRGLANRCDEKSDPKACLYAYDRAKSDYEQALPIAQKLGFNYAVSAMNGSIRDLERFRQFFETDKNSFERLAKLSVFNPKTPDKVLVTELFLSREKQLPADPLFEELTKHSGNADGYFLEGQIRLLQRQDESASRAFAKATELLDSDRRSLRDGVVRGSFLEDRMNIYYFPLLDFLDRRKYAEAFDLLERSKSRAMADLLRSQELELKGPAERKFYAASVNLDANISRLQKDLFTRRTAGESGERIAAIEREIQKLDQDRQNLVKNISTEGLKLRELVAPQTATLAQLQQAMRQDRFEVLSYLALKSQVILWHISGDAVNVRSVFLPRLALTKKVADLRQSLSERGQNDERKFDEQTAQQLFLFLVQPALQWIKTDHLVIIPHDDLNHIPFQVLQNPADNKFLGESFRLSYIPNATTLLKLKKMESIRGGNLLAAADPNDTADFENEVRAIGALHSGRNKIITDRLIDEASLKAQVADYKLVHLSVHGEFDRGAPLLSHLKLSKGGGDDGKLTAAEMFGLPLARDSLVVLSACETGQAQATSANEVLGMVRALLYAGANNLILSSWRVDAASTALWMETFYREAQSKPLSEAARRALLAVKNDPKYSHPYYWSPFLLIGK